MSAGAPSAAHVLGQLEAIAQQQLGRVDPLVASAKLAEEVAPDSLARLTLIMAVENAFEICVGDEEASKLVRVSDVVALVQHKLAAKGA